MLDHLTVLPIWLQSIPSHFPLAGNRLNPEKYYSKGRTFPSVALWTQCPASDPR